MVESQGLATLAGDGDPGGQSDQELVDQARAGRHDARETLARRYRQAAFVLALQMLGNRDDAMDVAQDAMLRFFTSLNSFDRERPIQPWLFAIVRNQVRDLWRRRKRRPGDRSGEAGERRWRVTWWTRRRTQKRTCAGSSSNNASGTPSRRSRPRNTRSSCCATFTTCHTATSQGC